MKIAVTYDNGNIFQHFGKTENFKVYEVEDNQVVSSEVIGSNGTGHGALAGLLSEHASALKRVDFPTFGRPTMATTGLLIYSPVLNSY